MSYNYSLDAAIKEATEVALNAGKIGAPENQGQAAIALAIVAHAEALKNVASALDSMAAASRFRV